MRMLGGHVSNAEECTFTLPHNGRTYTEFSCLFPGFKKFYFDWEVNYFANGGYKIHEFISDSHTQLLPMMLPIVTVGLYLALIFWGKKYMEDRKPWQWKNQLAVWNFCLSVFSFWGFIRLLPPTLYQMKTLSLRDNVCGDPYGSFIGGSSGTWVQFFILSKFPELIDTFFIIIHKKPLMFLHYYHHVSVLLYVWFCAYATVNPIAPVFGTMNYGVHAMMYGYYFLMAIGMKPKWLNPMYITSAQILQMVSGIVTTAVALFYYLQTKSDVSKGLEVTCKATALELSAAVLMYGSYLFLFVQFFAVRFSKPMKKKVV